MAEIVYSGSEMNTSLRLTILLALIPLGGLAQTRVQVPPMLIGLWNDHLRSTACDARSEANGITITLGGEIIENNAKMICRIEKFSVGEASQYLLGSWSYEGTCTIQPGEPGRTIPLFGRMWIDAPEDGKPPVLERIEDQESFGTIWDPIPMTRRMSTYWRCTKT